MGRQSCLLALPLDLDLETGRVGWSSWTGVRMRIRCGSALNVPTNLRFGAWGADRAGFQPGLRGAPGSMAAVAGHARQS
jgi:hypothetical protein